MAGIKKAARNRAANFRAGAKRALSQLSPTKASPSTKRQRRDQENVVPVSSIPSPTRVEERRDSHDIYTSEPLIADIPHSPSSAARSPRSLFGKFKLNNSQPSRGPSSIFKGRVRLEKPTERVDDTASIMTSATFPCPAPPRQLVPDVPNSSHAREVATLEDEEPIDDSPDEPFDPNEPSELNAPAVGTFSGDGYPRPAPPLSFVERMSAWAKRPGNMRAAPAVGDAERAAHDIYCTLRGDSRGQKHGGYKEADFEVFRRQKLVGMQAMLNAYIHPMSATFQQWGASARQAAIGLGRGDYCAEALARLCRRYIEDRSLLPINPYGKWTSSMLADEDLQSDIDEYLMSLGKDITVSKLVQFFRRPDIKEKHNIAKDVSETTARRYLHSRGYRFMCPKKGQYSDGHERADVVYYRKEVYLPRLRELYEHAMTYDPDGLPYYGPLIEGKRVVIWFHDESIFYAHDRRRKHWLHKDAPARPYQKGDGASFMVADYISADFGWLKGRNGETARRVMRPGKNKDGYFTCDDIKEQAEAAIAILHRDYPDFDHIFVYDNASTHLKRPEGSLSARNMPKYESKLEKNWLIEVNVRDPSTGQQVYTSNGKYKKTKIPMTGAWYKAADGTIQEQALYRPSPDSAKYAVGPFRGMKALLEERGLHAAAQKLTQCPGFNCEPPAEDCCCRRTLYNQPDFQGTKSVLEITCQELGVEVLFLPKFHCELNPIEMCWGYAKRVYRLYPESSREDVLERNALAALEAVPLASIRRFANRTRRFGDAYLRGLNGAQAIWAAKKYRGHRVLPETIMAELDKANVH